MEEPGISSIWIQLTYPGRKPVLVQALYRQHQRLGVAGSKSISRQQERWDKILSKWELAAQEQVEIITMGDLNLNSLSWKLSEAQKSSQDRSQARMSQMLQDRILSKGFTLIGDQPTRTPDNPQSRPAALDLIITNRLDKVENFQVGLPSFSDHLIQTLTRRTRDLQVTQTRIKIRSFKHYSAQQYRDNVRNHNLYIETLYEKDPHIITANIQQIITESLAIIAPIKIIQVDKTNKTRLSETTRTLLALRDTALQEMKLSPTQDNIREYKMLKNQANRAVNIEKWKRASASLQAEDSSNSNKWKKVKKMTGQKKFTSPQIIIEGNSHYMSPGSMAAALNRQYIQKVKSVISQIPETDIDPLVNFERVIGKVTHTLSFKQISMGELVKMIDSMKPTGSAGKDEISMRMLKDARAELQPLILILVNQAIKLRTYPEQLKTTKIVPIEKKGKTKTTSDGWRPVNVVPALSKILERVLLRQMINHMEINSLIDHSHHGAVRGKSTQTVIVELYDKLMQNLEEDDDSALLILDQSKAYEIVSHEILLRKLHAIGYTNQAIDMIASFLSNRKQYVQIQAMKSDKLLTGPHSVVQGSTVSCILFLIFVLDLPQIFHDTPNCPDAPHNPQQQSECVEPNTKSFVDDEFIVITKKKDDPTPLKDKIEEAMKKITEYTLANKLALNQEKSLIMIVTKKAQLREHFEIQLGNKMIKHQKNVRILGNIMSEDLTWDHHIQKELIPALKNRARTLKLIGRYMAPKFRAIYAQAIFKSKILFGAESWGGSKVSLINQIQAIQDKVVKYTVGPENYNQSIRQKHQLLKWLSIKGDIAQATMKMTHKILNVNTPEEIATKMPMNTKSLRVGLHRKLDTKPRFLTKNKLTRASFRARAYHYNLLPEKVTSMVKMKDFKKELKAYLHSKWTY